MKTSKRLLPMLLAIILAVAVVASACSNNVQGLILPPQDLDCQHQCNSCHKCTDINCTDTKCAQKCLGHTAPSDTYTIYYFVGNHAAVSATTSVSFQYKAGETVTLVQAPQADDGWLFVGWFDGTTIRQAGASYTMPSHDVIMIAQWIEQPFVNLFVGILNGKEVTITLNDDGTVTFDDNSDGYTYKLEGFILTLLCPKGVIAYLEININERTFIQLDQLYKVTYTSANDATLTFDGKGGVTLGNHTGIYELLLNEESSVYGIKFIFYGTSSTVTFEQGVGTPITGTITIDGVDYLFGTNEADNCEWKAFIGIFVGESESVSYKVVITADSITVYVNEAPTDFRINAFDVTSGIFNSYDNGFLVLNVVGDWPGIVNVICITGGITSNKPIQLERTEQGNNGPGPDNPYPPTHKCEDVCQYCLKCTTDCSDDACQDKCEGHYVPVGAEDIYMSSTGMVDFDEYVYGGGDCAYNRVEIHGNTITFSVDGEHSENAELFWTGNVATGSFVSGYLLDFGFTVTITFNDNALTVTINNDSANFTALFNKADTTDLGYELDDLDPMLIGTFSGVNTRQSGGVYEVSISTTGITVKINGVVAKVENVVYDSANTMFTLTINGKNFTIMSISNFSTLVLQADDYSVVANLNRVE